MSALLDHWRGWLPARIFWQDGAPWLDWYWLDKRRLTEPFFEQAVAQLRHTAPRRQTPLAALLELAAALPAAAPSGLIFHMSRCGSTLLAQLLARSPRTVVLAEPPPLDALLRITEERPDLSAAEQAAWIAALVRVLGWREPAAHTFIKLDSWHTLALPLLRLALPDAPRLFVYREPHEVLASHVREPGLQMVPGLVPPALFGLPDTALALPLLPYRIAVLRQLLAAALAEPQLWLLNYQALPEAVWTMLPAHWGVAWTAAERDTMQAAALVHAKRPYETFAPDAAAKRALLSAADRALIDAESGAALCGAGGAAPPPGGQG